MHHRRTPKNIQRRFLLGANKEGFLQMSFAWLFAIIVGAVILFLAIFIVTKMIGTQEEVTSVKTAKEIGVLLNPLETGFEIGKTTMIAFPTETRIYNKCDNVSGFFGKQGIQISQKSFEKWTKTDLEVSFPNKYIFSGDYSEGKIFYIFSKPLDFPFKVTDLIYLTSSEKSYCFMDAPEHIQDELEALDQKNIFIEECDELKNNTEVCFRTLGCDIDVDYLSEKIMKNNENIYFKTDALMYAAIFSDSEVYNCQLQRLMQRLDQLAQIYKDKESFISQKGCSSNLGGDLIGLGNSARELSSSHNINSVWNFAETIQDKNELNSQCKLF